MSQADAPRRARVRDLFDQLADLDPAEAAARLAGEEPDATIRAEVQALLAADSAPTAALNLTPDDLASIFAEDAREGAARLVGSVVGQYRLLEVIGVGGMGAVFRALREDIGLTVALKLVRGALGDPARISRFRREQQVLAQLDHPNIARLLDAGVAPDGTQYLVMGYVAGDVITRWCREHRVGVTARLRLFRALCDAVGYAHQNLVVHRDLKPSNVLVTSDGTVMLLDFGVAKLIEAGAGDSVLTRSDGRIFSPEYASPEQLSGGAITTATDVYGLGLLLFELLTGQRPFPAPVRGKPFDVADRPLAPRPTAVGSDAAGFDAADRQRADADLDAICLKALAAEPNARYASVAELIRDVDAYLDGRPVMARLPTRRYRAGKWLRRNRAAAAIIGLGGALAVFLGGNLVVRAREAQRALAEAQDLSEFVLEVFRATGPSEARGSDVPVESFLKLAGIHLEALQDRPELRARTLGILALGYLGIGDYATAEAQARESATAWSALGPRHRTEVAGALRTLGTALYLGSDPAGAADVLRPALAVQREELGDAHRETTATMILLADVIREQGELLEAERLAREALAVRLAQRVRDRARGGEDQIVDAMTVLATILDQRGSDSHLEAERLLRDGLAIREALYGPEDVRVDPSLAALGDFLNGVSRGAEAEALARRSLEIRRAIFGDVHPRTIAQLNAVAEAVLTQERPAEARAIFERVVRQYETAFGGDHLMLVLALEALSRTQVAEGRYAEAERQLQRALAMRVRLEGPESAGVAQLHADLATVQLARNNLSGAEASLREAARQHARFWGASAGRTLRTQALLGSVVGRRGRHDEAETLLRAAIRGQTALVGGVTHTDLATSWSELGVVLAARGDLDGAEAAYREALLIVRTALGPGHERRERVVRAVVDFYVASDRRGDAERLRAEELGVAPAVPLPTRASPGDSTPND